MRNLLEFFKVDRFGLVTVLPNKDSYIITHLVSSSGVPSIPVGVELPLSNQPWAQEKLIMKQEALSFTKLDEIPAEANMDKKHYTAWGVRSNLNIPIIDRGIR